MNINELILGVKDEQSFLHFLRVLREVCERACSGYDHDCFAQDHWPFQTVETKDFLRAAEDWGSKGDFGAGRHHGDPMLQRIAAMLVAASFKVRDIDRDSDHD